VFVAHAHLAEDIFNLESPPNLGSHNANHADFFSDPLHTVSFGIVIHGALDQGGQSLLHFIVNLAHPVFDLAFWLNLRFELILLLLVRGHVRNDLVTLSKGEFLVVVVELEQERLNAPGVGRTQDLQQVVIGNEVESCKNVFLRLQIIGQTFLAFFEFKRDTLQLVKTLATFCFHASGVDVRV
jgi:hypothetical protein